MAPPMASVEVAVNAPPKKAGPFTYALPCIDKSDEGEVVPSPTEPPEVAKYAEPEEVMAVVEAYGKVLAVEAVEVKVEVAVMALPKKAVPLVYWLPWTERSCAGEVVPSPTLPALLM